MFQTLSNTENTKLTRCNPYYQAVYGILGENCRKNIIKYMCYNRYIIRGLKNVIV